MPLGISSGMLSNAVTVGQERLALEQRKKGNIAAGISSLGASIASGIQEDKRQANDIAMEEARAERERAAREAFQKQAQDFQWDQAERARTNEVQDQETQYGRQARGNAAAFKAAGLNVPAGAAQMSPAMVGPLTSKLLGDKEQADQRKQFGSLMAPTPAQSVQIPMMGHPGLPLTLPPRAPKPNEVATRAGTMPGGVDPGVFAKAMDGSQAVYPQPKEFAPRGIDPRSQEGILADITKAQAEAKAKGEADMAVESARIASREGMQREMNAAKMELEKLKMSNDPTQRRDAIMALQARKSGIPVLLAKLRQSIAFTKDEGKKAEMEADANDADAILRDIDTKLQQFETPQQPSAPTQAPAGTAPTWDQFK